jgi:hypothetical protein
MEVAVADDRGAFHRRPVGPQPSERGGQTEQRRARHPLLVLGQLPGDGVLGAGARRRGLDGLHHRRWIERVELPLRAHQHAGHAGPAHREQRATGEALHDEEARAEDAGVRAGDGHARRRIPLLGDSVLDGLLAERAAWVVVRREHAQDQRAGQIRRHPDQAQRVDRRVETARHRRRRLGEPDARAVERRAQVLDEPGPVDHAGALTTLGRARSA